VLTLVIGILIIVVIGAILFWVIDKFCPDARLAQLLKLLARIMQRFDGYGALGAALV
jgi:surface polysaccharide O-acyltransferase-like enzyme